MFGCSRSSNFFGENIIRFRAHARNPFTRKADCPMKSWIYLTFAILAEVVGTSCLKASQGFTKPIPSLVVVAGYGLAFYLLSLTLETIPVGVGYAVWSGVGLVLITLVGWLLYGQTLDAPAVLGMGCIVVGVLILNLYSRVSAH